MVNEQLSRLKEKGVTEARKLLWIFAYLWVLLGLFALHKSLVLHQPHPFYHQGFAVINALVMAKVMFFGEVLQVADGLKQRPLIYPIAYKSAVFALILVAFHVLEEIGSKLWRGMSFAESIREVQGDMMTLLVFGVIMFVVLMPFFALREIARDVGADKLYEQFFLRRNRYVPMER